VRLLGAVCFCRLRLRDGDARNLLHQGHDAENDEAELAGAKQLAALREEMMALREEIRRTTTADNLVVKRDSVEEGDA